MEGLADFQCVICNDLLIEPVKLPCKHSNFCLECLDRAMHQVGVTCPLCKKYCGAMWRAHKDKKELIDTEKWEIIKRKFPKEVESKNANELVIRVQDAVHHNFSEPGEVGQEILEQAAKLSSEIQKEIDAENRASMQYINELLKEERKSCITERVTRQKSTIQPKCPIFNYSRTNSTSDEIATMKLIKKIVAEENKKFSPKRRRSSKQGTILKYVRPHDKVEKTFRPIDAIPTTGAKPDNCVPAIHSEPAHTSPLVILEKIDHFSENSAFYEIKAPVNDSMITEEISSGEM